MIAATGSCISATFPIPANFAACKVASFFIWLNAAGTVITVAVSGSFLISSGRYPNKTLRISALHSSGVSVKLDASSSIFVLVPIKRLNKVAELFGL